MHGAHAHARMARLQPRTTQAEARIGVTMKQKRARTLSSGRIDRSIADMSGRMPAMRLIVPKGHNANFT
jgi:hypothetical protein